MNALTHKRDGKDRNPSIVAVLKHFRFEHLPDDLRDISRDCHDLALKMADRLPEGPDVTMGLRELLAAKDNFVRANT